MQETNDHELLAQFTQHNSEAAFAALVSRHVNLVYSVALRKTGRPDAAEEIAQAVFIILARKAHVLPSRTILAAWLCETARLTAANYLRTEIRRQNREQEAHMQSLLNEPPAEDMWKQITPLLDDALANLGTPERNAVVLRFFENKNLREVGTALGVSEDAAKRRVYRALEKMRKVFLKRGVTLSAAALSGMLAANSVQAAPVALAANISATAAQGSAVTASTLTLVKGALKLMAWTKAQTAMAVGVGVLLAAGTATVVMEKAASPAGSILTQKLPDGPLLALNQVSFGEKHEFVHHGIPKHSWNSPGQDYLVLEFSLAGDNVASHPLVKPPFYRQFRFVLRGEQGIEYVEELESSKFEEDAGEYYGYLETSIFPRDSRWLWVRLEKRDDNRHYESWQTVAEFKILNPAHPANLNWTATPSPATNTVAGKRLVIGQITVKTVPNYPHDIWNHVVTVPTEVWEHDVLLTNWRAAFVHMKDASGNWSPILQFHRSLDPRYIWKLDMDFEPESDFPDDELAVVHLPVVPGSSIDTNVLGQSVTFSWDSNDSSDRWLNANMPTNRPELALKLVGIKDDHGSDIDGGSGSWNQHFFRRSLQPTKSKEVDVTIAIVPNVHTTFYAQPRLITDLVK